MNNLDQINAWCAEVCGVEIADNPDCPSWSVMTNAGMLQVFCEWDYRDSRCREICREYFRIDTITNPEKNWIAFVYTEYDTYFSTGATIAEAEIVCIEAIWETRNGM